jgi:DNA-binding NtrC family response regulator
MRLAKNLLFVDDEKEILDILVDLFSDDGYNLHTATKASEALQISDGCHVDFVMSDLKLPDATGTDLLEQIHTRHPKAVRVLSSGYLDVQFGHVAKDTHNGTYYVSKPWDLFTLKNLVTEQLG